MPPRDRTPEEPAAETSTDDGKAASPVRKATGAPRKPAEPTRRPAEPARKGRPTPKRREAEQARRRPLVPDGRGDRKALKAQAKARRELEYQAMITGDDRNLPPRDKGPVRRWVRDYVDARHNPGEYFLPVSIVIVMATFFTAGSPALGLAVIGLLYLVVFITVGDAFLLGRRIHKRLVAKFGEQKIPRGIKMYGIMRAFQMRRTRLPKPQVKRGEFPR